MTIPETVLTFVGIPAAIVLVIAVLVIGPGELRAPSRYRPGRPWAHSPVWFIPHPAAIAGSSAATHTALASGSTAAAIESAGHSHASA
ncbi:MAG: hypothetical protein JO147_04325, partial [Actinobacteria bacterium]|nr:hypothetical protein [Actinomycetota bacterium]